MVKVTTTQVWVTISLIAIFGIGGSAMIFFSMPDSGTLANDTKPIIVKDMPKIVESAPVVEKYPQTSQIILDDNLILDETIVTFDDPKSNKLPWGTIKGNVINPAPGHPVIIQIFESLDNGPIHVGQVNLDENGLFEYKIRVLSVDDGITTHIFEGNYFVKVTKVKIIS